MKENKKSVVVPTQKGFILHASEVVPAKAPENIMVLDDKGKIQTIKREMDSPSVGLSLHYPLLRPTAQFTNQQPEPSLYTTVTLHLIKPGNSEELHYDEYNAEMPIYDVALFVISGQIRVTVGDIEKTVGADTLIYSPSNVTRSLTNIGTDVAKILRMSGSVGGTKMGRPVYSKRPTWI
jgi:mannose-6-phosphate isomerase-like protein (cupin superfamily)